MGIQDSALVAPHGLDVPIIRPACSNSMLTAIPFKSRGRCPAQSDLNVTLSLDRRCNQV